MRTVKRILKIDKIEQYRIYCLFNNGQFRIIDFKKLFDIWNVGKDDPEWPLLQSEDEFSRAELIDGTLVWENIQIPGEDDQGKPTIYYYDIDPIVLYENSIPDEERQVQIGRMIRNARHELKMTQEELAQKSGTTKHYISRLENNKTGVELATLIRIIEGGLGRSLKIEIQ